MILNFALNELDLAKVVAETQTANKSSCRLLERVGMEWERTISRFGAEQAIYSVQSKNQGGNMENKYNLLENEEVIYYVYKLNWHLPKTDQEDAISVLSDLSPEQVDLLIPKYGKECYENAVSILQKMGYPRIKKALPRLVWLLNDINWPGALKAIEIFKSIDKEIIVPYIEDGCVTAIKENDPTWLEFIKYACDDIGISKEDFTNQDPFAHMVELGEKYNW
jgi:hypothetical protein